MNNFERPRSSHSDKHVSTGPTRRALLTQDNLDMLKLEARRRELSDDADETQESALGLAAVYLIGPTSNPAAQR